MASTQHLPRHLFPPQQGCQQRARLRSRTNIPAFPGNSRSPGHSPEKLRVAPRCLQSPASLLRGPSHVSPSHHFPCAFQPRAPCQSAPAVPGSNPHRAVSTHASLFPAAPPAPHNPPAARSRKLSDAFWPGFGAFVTFCGLAWLDQALASQRLFMSLASYGAVCSLLFAAPKAPVSHPRRVLLAHVACALIGVGAMRVLGITWLARSAAVALSISAMILTDTMHPPAAGLPVIFIDGPKFHHLGWWYPIYPVIAGCLWIFLLQELVLALKEGIQF